jgi:hypothetical protein
MKDNDVVTIIILMTKNDMMANDNENTVIMTIILIENNVETEEK